MTATKWTEGDPVEPLPPAWRVKSRERENFHAGRTDYDVVTYERDHDALRVCVSDVPLDEGGFKRMVSASSPSGHVCAHQCRTVERLFLWRGRPIERRAPLFNAGVEWWVQRWQPAATETTS